MNWAKAKNVIIVIFAVLNVFLLANIIIYKYDGGISAETLSNTKAALAAREIAVNCNIPGAEVDNFILSLETHEPDRETIIGAFLESDNNKYELTRGSSYDVEQGKIDINNDGITIIKRNSKLERLSTLDQKSAKDYIVRVFKETKIPIKEFQVDEFIKYDNGDTAIKLVEKYKDFYVYDNYVKLTIYSDKTSLLEFNYKAVTGLKKDKASGGKVKPVYQILLNNYTKGSATSIEAIDAGFKCGNGDDKSKLIQLRPVWRIKTGGDKTDYYNAYTGEKLN